MIKRVGVIIFALALCAACSAWADSAAPALTIDQAVQMAVEKNVTLRTARDQVEIARSHIGQAKAGMYPQLGAEFQYQDYTVVPLFVLPPAGSFPGLTVPVGLNNNTVWSFNARQAIYTGGQITGSISKAEALFDVAAGQLGAAESQVALQTRQVYYSVLLNEALVRSSEQNLKAAQDQLTDASSRYDAGTAAKFDVLRAQTQVSQAQQALVQNKNQIDISRQNLNRIIGLPIDSVRTLSAPPVAAVPSAALPALIDLAEHQRAEMLSAKAQVKAAEYGIKVAKSSWMPQVALDATYLKFGKEALGAIPGWTIVASVNQEIFDGGRIRGQVREAKALKDEAKINLEDTTRGVEQDVRQAFLNLQTARTTIDTATALLAQATEAYDVATVRYQSGVGTATELADALATLTTARANSDTTRYNYDIAYAALQRALGLITY